MTMISNHRAFSPLRPTRVTVRPITLRKRVKNGFETVKMQRHQRPCPSKPLTTQQALRLAILQTPNFNANAMATAISIAVPFGLALLVLDAIGVSQAGAISPTLAEFAPVITRL